MAPRMGLYGHSFHWLMLVFSTGFVFTSPTVFGWDNSLLQLVCICIYQAHLRLPTSTKLISVCQVLIMPAAPSRGYLTGVSNFTLAKIPEIQNYHQELADNPSDVKEAWLRILCDDPDNLELDSMTVDENMVRDQMMGKLLDGQAGSSDKDEDRFKDMVKKAPFKRLLKKAVKESWEEVCASFSTFDGFLMRKLGSENQHVKIVLDYLMKMWTIIKDVEVDQLCSEFTKKEREAALNKAVKTMYCCIVDSVRDAKKGGRFWQKEAYKHFVSPSIKATNDSSVRPRSRSRERSSARKPAPNKALIDQYLNVLAKEGKKVRDEGSGRPYRQTFCDVVVRQAAQLGEVDENAAKIAIAKSCKNCFLYGKIATHTTSDCPYGKKDKDKGWLLMCPKAGCGGCHPARHCKK
jgi:hypothetical protein